MDSVQTAVFIALFIVSFFWTIFFVIKRRLADAMFVFGMGFIAFYLMLENLKLNNEIQVMMSLAKPSWANLPDWVYISPLIVAVALVILSAPMILVDRKKRHYQKAMDRMS